MWRGVTLQGMVVDDVAITRGENVVNFLVSPSGGLSDTEIAALADAQHARMPEGGASANSDAYELGKRAVQLLGRLVLLGVFISLIVWLTRRRRSGSDAASSG